MCNRARTNVPRVNYTARVANDGFAWCLLVARMKLQKLTLLFAGNSPRDLACGFVFPLANSHHSLAPRTAHLQRVQRTADRHIQKIVQIYTQYAGTRAARLCFTQHHIHTYGTYTHAARVFSSLLSINMEI